MVNFILFFFKFTVQILINCDCSISINKNINKDCYSYCSSEKQNRSYISKTYKVPNSKIILKYKTPANLNNTKSTVTVFKDRIINKISTIVKDNFVPVYQVKTIHVSRNDQPLQVMEKSFYPYSENNNPDYFQEKNTNCLENKLRRNNIILKNNINPRNSQTKYQDLRGIYKKKVLKNANRDEYFDINNDNSNYTILDKSPLTPQIDTLQNVEVKYHTNIKPEIRKAANQKTVTHKETIMLNNTSTQSINENKPLLSNKKSVDQNIENKENSNQNLPETKTPEFENQKTVTIKETITLNHTPTQSINDKKTLFSTKKSVDQNLPETKTPESENLKTVTLKETITLNHTVTQSINEIKPLSSNKKSVDQNIENKKYSNQKIPETKTSKSANFTTTSISKNHNKEIKSIYQEKINTFYRLPQDSIEIYKDQYKNYKDSTDQNIFDYAKSNDLGSENKNQEGKRPVIFKTIDTTETLTVFHETTRTKRIPKSKIKVKTETKIKTEIKTVSPEVKTIKNVDEIIKIIQTGENRSEREQKNQIKAISEIESLISEIQNLQQNKILEKTVTKTEKKISTITNFSNTTTIKEIINTKTVTLNSSIHLTDTITNTINNTTTIIEKYPQVAPNSNNENNPKNMFKPINQQIEEKNFKDQKVSPKNRHNHKRNKKSTFRPQNIIEEKRNFFQKFIGWIKKPQNETKIENSSSSSSFNSKEEIKVKIKKLEESQEEKDLLLKDLLLKINTVLEMNSVDTINGKNVDPSYISILGDQIVSRVVEENNKNRDSIPVKKTVKLNNDTEQNQKIKTIVNSVTLPKKFKKDIDNLNQEDIDGIKKTVDIQNEKEKKTNSNEKNEIKTIINKVTLPKKFKKDIDSLNQKDIEEIKKTVDIYNEKEKQTNINEKEKLTNSNEKNENKNLLRKKVESKVEDKKDIDNLEQEDIKITVKIKNEKEKEKKFNKKIEDKKAKTITIEDIKTTTERKTAEKKLLPELSTSLKEDLVIKTTETFFIHKTKTDYETVIQILTKTNTILEEKSTLEPKVEPETTILQKITRDSDNDINEESCHKTKKTVTNVIPIVFKKRNEKKVLKNKNVSLNDKENIPTRTTTVLFLKK